MNPLAPELRRLLERTAGDAREVAERGARAALEGLAVHEREPYAHMTPEQRALRRKLRVHARQLGDRRDQRSGGQAVDRLVQECACEQWHGMLFARFLAENRLLLEPELGVPVTLAECEELAKDEGADQWALAARFGRRMLPQVFRPDHPAFALRPAREHRLKLETLVESLPAAAFHAADSLGWFYQFWQSRKKDAVNRSEVKIGADELPAVTQLFTEPYMVSFLLDNTLGAWWAARILSADDLAGAASEAELRRKAALPGVPLAFLRFVRAEDGQWRPAAGAFDAWPDSLGKLKILDPCCGSGHFLTAALAMLVPMRMVREGLDARAAVDAALRDNLHGLELDPRCVEIAAFALALAAWTRPGAEGFRPLPELHLACSGLAVGAAKERWTELAAGNRNLRLALERLYEAFGDAPTLGSLLDPAATDAAKLADWPRLSAALAQALGRERSDERREAEVAAQGAGKAADLLAGRYHLTATNVPYLTSGKQSEKLRYFMGKRYPAAKNDLATAFLERCLQLCTQGGTAALVLPQNWLFLTSYRKLREKLLQKETWHLLARLGEGGFDSTAAAGAFVALLALSRGKPAGSRDGLLGDAASGGVMYGLDVSESRTAKEKAARLIEADVKGVEQARQLENPDCMIRSEALSEVALLENFASSYAGVCTGDYPRFGRQFWEVTQSGKIWEFQCVTVDVSRHYGGMSNILRWEENNGQLRKSVGDRLGEKNIGSWIRGHNAWGNIGVTVKLMRELPVAIYEGELFDNNVAVLIPKIPNIQLPLYTFCESSHFVDEIRKNNQKMSVETGYLLSVPFDLDYWQKVAAEKYPNGLPRPYSDDPTQWIFHGHPCGSVVWDETEKRTARGPLRTDATVLQTAVARLLGYRWPAEGDAAMELAAEQREQARRCEALLPYADADGIVCIPSVRGEPPAEERLRQLAAAAYGDAWNEDALRKLLAASGGASLDDWLRNRFFEQHCKLFRQRPFVWHVWDGRRRDGFHALLNYHKLAAGEGRGRRLLESLTYSYLGDWIGRQSDGVKRKEEGAEDRLTAALELQQRLAAVLAGEPPCDIFVRWKPLEEQPIGWEPDIDDGVRLNIRPFMAADIPGGKKGAGILRAKPNVHWRKDRGKEPHREQERFPWFRRNGEFTGERLNDVHLSIAQKRQARQGEETEG